MPSLRDGVESVITIKKAVAEVIERVSQAISICQRNAESLRSGGFGNASRILVAAAASLRSDVLPGLSSIRVFVDRASIELANADRANLDEAEEVVRSSQICLISVLDAPRNCCRVIGEVTAMMACLGARAQSLQAQLHQARTRLDEIEALQNGGNDALTQALRSIGAAATPVGATIEMGTRAKWRKINAIDSPIPAPPKEPGDAVLPNDCPVYYRKHATVIGYDSATFANADFIKSDPKFHDVIVHGSNTGYFIPGAVNTAGENIRLANVHPNHIADAIIGNPSYNGNPIRLISCWSGTVNSQEFEVTPAAKAIATRLGVTVKAPTNVVGLYPEDGADQEPVHFNGGRWILFDSKEIS